MKSRKEKKRDKERRKGSRKGKGRRFKKSCMAERTGPLYYY
jgi:hypothetical protein